MCWVHCYTLEATAAEAAVGGECSMFVYGGDFFLLRRLQGQARSKNCDPPTSGRYFWASPFPPGRHGPENVIDWETGGARSAFAGQDFPKCEERGKKEKNDHIAVPSFSSPKNLIAQGKNYSL